MGARTTYEAATTVQRFCQAYIGRYDSHWLPGYTQEVEVLLDVVNSLDEEFGFPVVRTKWSLEGSPGATSYDWIYFVRGPHGTDDLGPSDLEIERPWYHWHQIVSADATFIGFWTTVMVPNAEALLERLYHCEITAVTTDREMMGAGYVKEARLYLGDPVDGKCVFVLALGVMVFKNTIAWHTTDDVTLPDALDTDFMDFDPLSGIMVDSTISGGGGGGGGGDTDIDLTPLIDKLDEIKDSIDDISLNASVNHGQFEVSLRGADAGGEGEG